VSVKEKQYVLGVIVKHMKSKTDRNMKEHK